MSFPELERRVQRECDQVGQTKANKLVRDVGRQLGYNPDAGTWWASDEYLAAVKPLQKFAEKRLSEIEMRKVWGEAEKAALDVLKKGVV